MAGGPTRSEEIKERTPAEQAAREAELTGRIKDMTQAAEDAQREIADRMNEGDFTGAKEAREAADRARAEREAAEDELRGMGI